MFGIGLRRGVFVVAAIAAGTIPVTAQIITATISGTVRDTTGSA
ncbi:MAG: hypothetical protein ACRD2N_13275 [Vicinamibacterales bacterium]